MRILVLGGDGMLGHQLLRAWRDRHDIHATLRLEQGSYGRKALFDVRTTHFGIDVRRIEDLVTVMAEVRPDAVVNAVGIVKQRPTAKDAIPSIEVNALFPHQLAELCGAANARLIHLSTDCVFSGLRGAYCEEDPPDAVDLYGRTKSLGEVGGAHCLTLRTSIIGLEVSRKTSLIEWYLAQRGTIRGFRRAIYTGLTTREMARAIEHFLVREPALCGVWHLASEPINKFDLLSAVQQRLRRSDVEIVPDDTFVCDRSLDSKALLARTSYRVPPWDAMLDELAEEIVERGAGGVAE